MSPYLNFTSMVVGEFHIFHGNSPEIKRGSAEHPPFSSIFSQLQTPPFRSRISQLATVDSPIIWWLTSPWQPDFPIKPTILFPWSSRLSRQNPPWWHRFRWDPPGWCRCHGTPWCSARRHRPAEPSAGSCGCNAVAKGHWELSYLAPKKCRFPSGLTVLKHQNVALDSLQG